MTNGQIFRKRIRLLGVCFIIFFISLGFRLQAYGNLAIPFRADLGWYAEFNSPNDDTPLKLAQHSAGVIIAYNQFGTDGFNDLDNFLGGCYEYGIPVIIEVPRVLSHAISLYPDDAMTEKNAPPTNKNDPKYDPLSWGNSTWYYGRTGYDAMFEYVNRYKNHPAVVGWYTADEPKLVNGVWVDLQGVAAAYNMIRNTFNSQKPVTICFSGQDNAPTIFAPYYDIMLYDQYPFVINQTEFGAMPGYKNVIDYNSNQAKTLRKPWWSVLQGMGRQCIPGTPGCDAYQEWTYRLPTKKEERFMLYYSLLKDAERAVVFSHKYSTRSISSWELPGSPTDPFPVNGTIWVENEVYIPLAIELGYIGPAISYGPVSDDLNTPYGIAPAAGNNIMAEMYIDYSGGGFDFYAIAMNKGPNASNNVMMWLVLPAYYNGTTVMFEDGRVVPLHRQFNFGSGLASFYIIDSFEPYGIHVYEFHM